MDSVDNGGDYPKASIGNYKGVMLCNRPGENGQPPRPDRGGLEPFNSRVDPKVPSGWNPTGKLQPRQQKKKRDPNSILVRHKKFLHELEQNKIADRENAMVDEHNAGVKMNKFKEQATKQREKIKALKAHDANSVDANGYDMTTGATAAALAQQQPLTMGNVDQFSEASAKKAVPSQKGAKKAKGMPAWAKTEKQTEEDKEAEVDDLLEFAYELDYEKYMEDSEVRMALAVIKDRVTNLDTDWKQKMVDDWNAADADQQEGRYETASQAPSQASRPSQMSNTSKTTSYVARVKEAKKREQEDKPEWDRSTVGGEKKKISAEDRMASQIAAEVLKDNHKLRAVHSKDSIKRILEKEARRQMQMHTDTYTGPQIVSHSAQDVPNMKKKDLDPSNLPYLHKNPAV